MVPADIWREIFSLLSEDHDVATLKMCSLTCVAWYQVARPLLWQSLYLDHEQVHDLRRVLNHTPDTVLLIRELSVRLHRLDVTLLPTFPNVHRLQLRLSEEVDRPHGRDPHLPPNTPAVLARRLPSVTSLTIKSDWTLLPEHDERMLACFPHLTSLTYSTLNLCQVWKEATIRDIHVQLPHLRTLFVSGTCYLQSLPSVLRASRDTLKSFKLCVCLNAPDVLTEALDLSGNPQLTSFELQVGYENGAFHWGDPLAIALSTLDHSNSALSEILYHALEFNRWHPVSWQVWRQTVHQHPARIGRALLRVLECLPQLILVFHKEGRMDDILEEIRKYMLSSIQDVVHALVPYSARLWIQYCPKAACSDHDWVRVPLFAEQE